MPAVVQVRNLSDEAHERLKRGAQARGWTMAGYIERLLDLHWTMLERASYTDITPADPDSILAAHGLQAVRV